MSVEVIFPKVDMDMQSGELIEWLCKSGDHVREGEPLFVIETDKSGMEVEALSSGTLMIIEDLSGQQVPVGQVMAHIYKDGESISDTQVPEPTVQKSSNRYSASATEEPVLDALTAVAVESGVGPAPTSALTLTNGSASGSRASPAARKLVRENDLVLSDVVGTSYRGRITKSDVVAHLAAVAKSQVSSADAVAMLSLVEGPAADKILPHSNMRKTIASRLTTACLTIPSYQVSIDCNCESLLRLKREIEQLTHIRKKSTNGSKIMTPKVTLNDFFVKALALSLRDHPTANSSWTEDARIIHASVDIGIAVALEDGLITPIVRNAAKKSISEISIETKSLIMRANNGILAKSDYQGGGSTISNLGMYGITQFTSIVNPPQASILSIGQVQKCPVVIEDRLSIAPVCKMTFTFDHRLIDGAVGAKLASSFKDYVENAIMAVI